MKLTVALTTLVIISVVAVFIMAGAESYQGGYQVCVPCHNGRTAPNLRGLFSSAGELIMAAKSVKDPMMRNIQRNDELLRAAAKDLGLK